MTDLAIKTSGLVREFGSNRAVDGVDLAAVSYTHLTLPTILLV